jgi:hypothetical protein
MLARMRVEHLATSHEPLGTILTIPHILHDCGLFDAAKAKYGIDVTVKWKFTVFLKRYWSHQPYLTSDDHTVLSLYKTIFILCIYVICLLLYYVNGQFEQFLCRNRQ